MSLAMHRIVTVLKTKARESVAAALLLASLGCSVPQALPARTYGLVPVPAGADTFRETGSPLEILPRQCAPASPQVTVLERLAELGYEVLEQKTTAPSSCYLIILPELHNLMNEEVTGTIADLAQRRLVGGLGLEGFVGERGEDVFERSRAAFADLRLDHLAEDSACFRSYSPLTQTADGLVVYGLENPELYRKALGILELARDMMQFESSVRLARRLNRAGREEALSRYHGLASSLSPRLASQGIVYTVDALLNPTVIRSATERVVGEVDQVCVSERNDYFISRVQAGDVIVVGAKHAHGLLSGFDGNSVVVNPIKGERGREFSRYYRQTYVGAASDTQKE